MSKLNKIKKLAQTVEKTVVPTISTTEENVIPLIPISGNLAEKITIAVEHQAEKYALVTAIKQRFPNGKMFDSKLRQKMKKIKRHLFFEGLINKQKYKQYKYSINLSKELKKHDYEEIADFVNLHKGKFHDLWMYPNSFDEQLNINKLAMFVRSIKHTSELDFYKSLTPEQWEVCVDGIINKPDYVINSLAQYKYDSRKINKALSENKGSKKTFKDVDNITKFLDTQKLKHNLTLYRGEGSFKIFRSIEINPFTKENLADILEKFTDEIEQGKHSEEEINLFIDKYLISQKVNQSRFLSTAIDIKSAKRYAKNSFG